VATRNGKPANGENFARAVAEVSERMSLLVREELELAKVEVTRKVTSIAKGAVAVGAGAVFGVFVVIFALMALAWGIAAIVVSGVGNIWIGFIAVAGLMFVLAIGAFLFAWRKLRVGAPKPDMAIDEARKIRETVAVKAGNGTAPETAVSQPVAVEPPPEPQPVQAGEST
jgi:hypothetical protein